MLFRSVGTGWYNQKSVNVGTETLLDKSKSGFDICGTAADDQMKLLDKLKDQAPTITLVTGEEEKTQWEKAHTAKAEINRKYEQISFLQVFHHATIGMVWGILLGRGWGSATAASRCCCVGENCWGSEACCLMCSACSQECCCCCKDGRRQIIQAEDAACKED